MHCLNARGIGNSSALKSRACPIVLTYGSVVDRKGCVISRPPASVFHATFLTISGPSGFEYDRITNQAVAYLTTKLLAGNFDT